MLALGPMRPKMVRKKSARSSASPDTCPLLALPRELLHQVLGMLDNDNLLKLMQTSKAMAQQVMQHSSGRLELKVQQPQGVSLSAIRRVLQWAPPACLKLTLDGLSQRNGLPHGDWEFQGLFGWPPSEYHAAGSQQGHQFPCLLEVAIKGFVVPTLVPADLTAACPNLRLVHLHDCYLEFRQHAGISNRGSRVTKQAGSSSRDSICVGGPTRVGTNVCALTLALSNVYAPELQKPPPANARLTRSTQAAAGFAERLRASVANVRCLKLCGRYPCPDFIRLLLGPRLTELHVEDGYLSAVAIRCVLHLQQLHKLVMPGKPYLSAAEMDLLLSLPNLAHVGLGDVDDLEKDYSSHPCKWQSLHLCLNERAPWLSLDTLAKLPIHSLTQPITLGSKRRDCIEVELPRNLAVIQRLSQQLMRCGVKVVPALLSWGPSRSGPYPSTSELVPAFGMIATAFGPHAAVQLLGMLVDQPILQAVATVYQDGLQELTLHFCKLVTDMQPARHAVLSGCPGLTTVVNSGGRRGRTELTAFVRGMMVAMNQQPSGRCITLVAGCCIECSESYEMVHHVRKRLKSEGAHEELAGVELTAIPDRCSRCLYGERLDPCMLITRQ